MSLLALVDFSIPIWKQKLRQSFTQVEKLADYLELDASQKAQLILKPSFSFLVPLRLAEKMAKKTLDDPLVRQFLPLKDELTIQENFVSQPVCDDHFQKTSKLLHKYQGRVLLVTTGACAMHCRYCFRQNFDYQVDKNFEEEIAWITADQSIEEVILSGGDPLSLSNNKLIPLLQKLTGIPHLTRIRFHTRFLIGIPERIDEDLLNFLQTLKQQIYIVIHCNHATELDSDVLLSLRSLQKIGCIILNQAVLLKGVNDDVQALVNLSQLLVNSGCLPYYLHQLDQVQGASHFKVSEENGHKLIQDMSTVLPGYAIPKYVKEIPYQPYKTPLLKS